MQGGIEGAGLHGYTLAREARSNVGGEAMAMHRAEVGKRFEDEEVEGALQFVPGHGMCLLQGECSHRGA